MADTCSRLIEHLNKSGYQARVVSISHVAEIERMLMGFKESGAITADFYPQLTRYFNFDYKASIPEAKSIIVVASRQPPTRVHFGAQSVLIPPTYIYRDIWKIQLNSVTEFLEPQGYKVKRARLPFKTLAVRSGLGKYGRNNVCYIEGIGSFHRLAAFYSDMPCEDENWSESTSMKVCQTCRACAKACPTGCIPENRFLIHAERCLTHFNESAEALPEWIKPEWHNSMLGCMECQKACPVNKPFLGSTLEAPESFDDAETQQILKGEPIESLSPKLKGKLESLCLTDEDVYPLLKRNLALLLNKSA
jgi:epoxyqueuosine reductase